MEDCLRRIPGCLRSALQHALEFAEALEPPERDLDCLELFAGKYRLTAAVQDAGFTALPFDKVLDPEQNVLCEGGFELAFRLLLRVRPGGLLWAAPECKTWVFVSRSTYKRSNSNPGGDQGSWKVVAANKLVSRTVTLCLVAWWRGLRVVVENPTSSIVPRFSPMRELITEVLRERVHVWLGNFGAPSEKPLFLWTNWPALRHLARGKPQMSTASSLVTKEADGRVTGNAAELHDSQAYPPEFGVAVANLLLNASGRLLPASATTEQTRASSTKTQTKAASSSAAKRQRH